MDTATQPKTTVEQSAIRKVAVRLVPFVALMFFINYLDRTAIGFAAPNGMNEDLGLTAAQFGFASGVFFIGYILLEVPSNLALHRFGARKWLARIMVSWGIVAALFTWVQNFEQLAALRFLLGVAEAGFFPGAILFLSLWVPAVHRGKILALFYLAQPLTTVFGAPLAGLLIQQDGVFLGLEGWRFMFLGVAIPAIVVGIIAWFYLKDRPADAKWLTPAEQVWLTDATRPREGRDREEAAHVSVKHAFKQRPRLDAVVHLLRLHLRPVRARVLPPDDHRGLPGAVRRRVRRVPEGPDHRDPLPPRRDRAVASGRATPAVAASAPGTSPVPRSRAPSASRWRSSPARRLLTIAVISITAMAIFAALPNFWTLPTQFLTGAAAAAGVALINTIGNIAGFSAPFLTGAVHDWTGGYEVPMFIVGGFMLLSAVLMIPLARRGRVAVAHGDETAEELVAEQLAPEESTTAEPGRAAR